MGPFGYTDVQWNAAKEEMRQALILRAREEDTMSYTELTTKILSLHFAPDDHALHHMLGRFPRKRTQLVVACFPS
jgi:hypothetical protein